MRPLLFLLTLALALPVLGAPMDKLASPAWSTVNIAPELAAFYADEVARVLRKEGLQVVTAKDMALALGLERQKVLLGCAEDATSCMAELGSALGCSGILTGSLAKLGHSYRGTLKVVSASNGRTVEEEPVEASGERELADALESAAARIGRRLNPPPPANLRRWSWAPLAGGLALGAGAAVGFSVAQERFVSIPRQSDPDRAQALASEGRNAEALAWSAAGVGTAALFGAAAMYLWGEPAAAPQVSWIREGAVIGIAGTLR